MQDAITEKDTQKAWRNFLFLPFCSETKKCRGNGVLNYVIAVADLYLHCTFHGHLSICGKSCYISTFAAWHGTARGQQHNALALLETLFWGFLTQIWKWNKNPFLTTF